MECKIKITTKMQQAQRLYFISVAALVCRRRGFAGWGGEASAGFEGAEFP
ncbi:MAG: hypothetical protein WC568_08470 [Candidatus Methanoperedens sp.]